MFQAMPESKPNCKFYSLDADEAPALVDHFQIDSVPALIIVHPHKNQPEVHQANVTPEFLNQQVSS